MLAKLSVDLRVVIDAEGRLPQAVVLVFAEPTRKGEVAIRVNEYVRDERMDRILDAVVVATAPKSHGEVLPMVDPYHPWRPPVASEVTLRDVVVKQVEHE